MKIIVRPLTKFGEIYPDPREYEDADGINKSIALHAGVFTAKSDFQFKDHSPIKFGQIITCYYEKGSITNSIFRGLRFEEPTGVEIAKSFQDLAAIDGVSAGSLFEAPGQLPGLMGDLIGLVQGALESLVVVTEVDREVHLIPALELLMRAEITSQNQVKTEYPQMNVQKEGFFSQHMVQEKENQQTSSYIVLREHQIGKEHLVDKIKN